VLGLLTEDGKNAMTVNVAVLGVGACYVIGIGVMFAVGWGIPAAFLTAPSWSFVVVLLTVLPQAALDAATSWTGNLLALTLSASLNVGALYWMVRRLKA
jgi:hypothetical protein